MTFYRRPNLSEGRQQKCRYRTISELENSVLEINHVTNVTTVLNETADQVGVLALPHATEFSSSEIVL